MRSSNSPPSYGQQQPQAQQPQAQQPQAQQPQGFAQRVLPAANAGGFGNPMQLPQTQMQQAPGGPPGPPPGPPPGGPPSAQPPISPQGYNAYRQLGTMPITGGGSRRNYNNAANQFAQQYGSGFDPSNMLARTKALRRQYGGKK